MPSKRKNKIYDLIIIGAGPAGLTAAIYAARRKLDFLVLTIDIGGQISWSSEVENYPGFHNINGIQLVKKFKEHIKDYDIDIEKEEAKKVKQLKNSFKVKTRKNYYKSKSIIIASGKKPKKLEVPGEEKLAGKGVFYCPTYNPSFFKNKNVAVIGGGNASLESSLFLSEYAKRVYLLDINNELSGTPALKERVENNEKIEHIGETKIKKILGNKKVESLIYEKNNKEKELDVGGIVIEIGLIPKCGFIDDIEKNKRGEIKIYKSTKSREENMTNIPGIFAAGDVTDVPAKQIVVAAGEGCKAALASFDYLDNLKK
ncbi:MAG: NAD(P)/FAD-dependent oxidoreductase [Nanoarchaeota archaeon]